MTNRKFKMVDLFCGCGGISRGFDWTGRFGTQWGVEVMPHPAAAFAANIVNVDGKPTRTSVADIEIYANDPDKLWSELRSCGIDSPGEIDVLAGGPPCQGFSRNGVRQYNDEQRSERFYDDPRNHLYKAFLAIVEQTLPKMLLIENVREFLNYNDGSFSKDLVTRLDELGYEVAFKKLCAADFGVPQVRWRVFFVAVRKDVAEISGIGPTFPEPVFSSTVAQPDLLSGAMPHRTVWDAIGDLPDASPEKGVALTYATSTASPLGRQLRSKSGKVSNHIARKLSPKQVERINAVGSGRMRDIAPELQTEKFYGSAYRRLSWDEPALTITTWVYHVGSGRFAHPTADRGLTMREAARLQSFDDDFQFSSLVNPVSQMIGNAVPPLMANQFASIYAEILDRYSDAVKRSVA